MRLYKNHKEDYIKYISRLNVGDIIECDIELNLYGEHIKYECTITSIPELEGEFYKFNIIGLSASEHSCFTEIVLLKNVHANKTLFERILLLDNCTKTYMFVNPDTIKINGKSVNEVLGYVNKYIC